MVMFEQVLADMRERAAVARDAAKNDPDGAAWQTINRLDPRRCVPALKELDGMLKVSYSGEVCYGV